MGNIIQGVSVYIKATVTCATPSSGEAAPAANETDSVRDRDQPRCNTCDMQQRRDF